MNSTLEKLQRLRDLKIIADIDYAFGAFIAETKPENSPDEIITLAALTSYSFNQHQNICLDLALLQNNYFGFFEQLTNRTAAEQAEITTLLQELHVSNPQEIAASSQLVATVDIHQPSQLVPLIMEGNKLYLQRFWNYEKKLADNIVSRANDLTALPTAEQIAQIDKISERIASYKDHHIPNYQKLAVLNALNNRFAVITGGPGTGKTTVITVILALLIQDHPELKINILAPTGKAQARVIESITEEVDFLHCSDSLKQQLCSLPSSTIHRLLKTIPGSPYFRHNAKNKLRLDVVIIDEVSMIPTVLMAKLFDALPSHCKIILLGDQNQLSSVEAGAVMANLCEVFTPNSFSADYYKILREHHLLGDNPPPAGNSTENTVNNKAVKLQRSYRFSPDKGIGQVTSKINRAANSYSKNEYDSILSLLNNDKSGEITTQELADSITEEGVQTQLTKFIGQLNFPTEKLMFKNYFKADSAATAYRLLSRFKILAAENHGILGVRKLNLLMEKILKLPAGKKSYHGRPIIITENNYKLNLFNGDIGIFWQQDGELQVYFPDPAAPGEQFRTLNPIRLPNHETVFAMTVHRSQGSGFDTVLLALPPKPEAQIINRELIYTGITRAKKELHFWFHNQTLQHALYRKTSRSTGLSSKIWHR